MRKEKITNVFKSWKGDMDGEKMANGGCCICGKKVGKNPLMVHMTTRGDIVPQDYEPKSEKDHDSQGCLAIGNECAKRVDKKLLFRPKD